jgi:hypothetical protein
MEVDDPACSVTLRCTCPALRRRLDVTLETGGPFHLFAILAPPPSQERLGTDSVVSSAKVRITVYGEEARQRGVASLIIDTTGLDVDDRYP